MTLRALALDIDGTLIDSRKQIMPFTRSEIHRVVAEYGVHPILITARGPQSTAAIERQLGVPSSRATFSGSLVWARRPDATLEPILDVPLRPADADRIRAAAASFDVHVSLYTQDTCYVSALDYWGLREARNTAVWPEVGAPPEGAPLYKIMFRGDEKPLAELAATLAQSPGSTYSHHLKYLLEIVSSDARKLPALEALCRHFGWGLDEVIAFGDTAADFEMLENAGVGILMGNSVLPLTGRVERTLSHDEDGVGMTLRKYFPTSAPFRP